ncbi:MAG: diadenylate cyclase CdaA [Angelakisella sp.]|nr:diadenylate cyclase CdaA [Angelakisella sp.]
MFKAITSIEVFWEILRSIRVQDVLDILIVAYLVYKLIDLLRETRAGQLIKGVLGIILVYVLAKAFQLRAVSAIIRYLITYGVFALLIIFQPELRKILERLGRTRFSLAQLRKTLNNLGGSANSFEYSSNMMRCINAICDSCAMLSKERIGALIVIERSTRLGDIIATGTLVDANPTAELIKNIFFPNSPLHDGAMVIREGRIHAAGCFLPLSNNYDISRTLGTRHRAALGMSEVSDALIVIVSEETGAISVAKDGKLNLRLTVNSLNSILCDELLSEYQENKGGPMDTVMSFFRRSDHE